MRFDYQNCDPAQTQRTASRARRARRGGARRGPDRERDRHRHGRDHERQNRRGHIGEDSGLRGQRGEEQRQGGDVIGACPLRSIADGHDQRDEEEEENHGQRVEHGDRDRHANLATGIPQPLGVKTKPAPDRDRLHEGKGREPRAQHDRRRDQEEREEGRPINHGRTGGEGARRKTAAGGEEHGERFHPARSWHGAKTNSSRRIHPPRPATRHAPASRADWSARHANSMITASTARLSPGLALIAFTTPSRSARKTFSIFIASTTASVSPALTSWPSLTDIDTTRPGMGQRTALPESAAFFGGISRAAAASRSV